MYISSLRPLLYHEILKTLIRDHFENTIPGIFKICLKKHVFFKMILKIWARARVPDPKMAAGAGPGPGPLPFLGQGPGPGP